MSSFYEESFAIIVKSRKTAFFQSQMEIDQAMNKSFASFKSSTYQITLIMNMNSDVCGLSPYRLIDCFA